MKTEKIQLKHPLKKHMPNIDKKKYDVIRKTMLSVLKGKELTHTELFAAMEKALRGKFAGSIGWYSESVKLDLEARNIIRRINYKPQKYAVVA